MTWHDLAACRDMDPRQFFPAPGTPVDPAIAAVCAACPVRQDCDTAGATEASGIWAGRLRDPAPRRRRTRRPANTAVSRSRSLAHTYPPAPHTCPDCGQRCGSLAALEAHQLTDPCTRQGAA